MLIARVVVETQPGHAGTVAERMARLNGMGPLSAESDCRVVADWKVPSGDTTEGLTEVLQAMNPEIVVVYPALVSEED